LSHYQSQTNYLESWIILPRYSFIKTTKEEIFTEITITYDEKKIQVPIYKKQFEKVLVFLIGFSNFNLTRFR
jgi:hypothetical protein